MTTITHEEYQNLISSEEEPYETAISMLPEEDRAEFLKAQNRYRTLQKEFMSKLKTLDPSLLRQYLRLEEAATDRNTYRIDSMYLKGVMDDHADLRLQGWLAP